MSTTASAASASTETATCTYCDDEYRVGSGYNRRWCSTECRYLGAAEGHLDALRRNHCFCSSCFRRLKTVFHPGQFYINQRGDLRPTPEFFVGLEDAKPGYDWDMGEEFIAERDPITNETVAVRPAGEKSTKVCECGVTHHKTVAFGGYDTPGAPGDHAQNFKDKLTLSELTTRAERLIEFVEDEQDWSVDHDVLFGHLRALKTSDELSGKAADWLILKHALAAGVRYADP